MTTHTRKSSLCAVLGAVLAGSTASLQALAQTPAGLEEIVVTAQRREQSLQDVPIAVSVFTAAAIESQRIQGVEDFVPLSPNVTFTSSGTRSSSEISVRGISNIGGATNVFGVYVDEFNVAPASSLLTVNQSLLDVERIEVLRGPQGTYFGRNVTGGAINITTKKPAPEFGGTVSVEAGSFDTYLGRISVNTPLVADRVFVRTSGFYEDVGGYFENVGPSDATNDQENYGARVALRALVTDKWTLDTSASYSNYRHGFPDYVYTGQPTEFFEAVGFPMVIPAAGVYPQNTDTISTDLPVIDESEALLVTGRTEYDGDGYRVVGVAGYIDAEGDRRGEADHIAESRYFNVGDPSSLDSWSAELRIQSDDESSWDWVIGGLYAEDQTSSGRDQRFGPDWGRFLTGFFGRPINPPAGVGFDIRNSTDRTAYGVFGDLTWHGFDGVLSVSLGSRWAHEEIREVHRTITFSPIPPFGMGDTGVLAGQETFNAFLPRLSVTFKPVANATLYGVVAKGVKPGGFNLGSGNFPNLPPTYGQEDVWSYEIGAKGALLDQRLRINLAAFYTKWDDIQVPGLFFDPTSLLRTPFTQNYPSARSKGAELELSVRPADRWLIEAAVGYNDAKFGDGPPILVAVGINIVDFVTGNRLPLSAEWTGNLAGEYRREMFGAAEGFVRVEYLYQGTRFTDVDNRPIYGDRIPKYDTVNVRAGAEWERFSVTAFGENLVNDDYITGYYINVNSFAGVLATVNRERFGVRLDYRF